MVVRKRASIEASVIEEAVCEVCLKAALFQPLLRRLRRSPHHWKSTRRTHTHTPLPTTFSRRHLFEEICSICLEEEEDRGLLASLFIRDEGAKSSLLLTFHPLFSGEWDVEHWFEFSRHKHLLSRKYYWLCLLMSWEHAGRPFCFDCICRPSHE